MTNHATAVEVSRLEMSKAERKEDWALRGTLQMGLTKRCSNLLVYPISFLFSISSQRRV